ncbi:hypothetical protein CJI97_000704 [Candidozyma auris]|nr:hypothetical protein CJI97_000704 [[Candida] auris]
MLRTEFDEYDPDVMIPLAEVMLKMASEIFPKEISVNDEKLSVHLVVGDGPHIADAIELVDKCMGQLYVKHKGKNWKDEKREELLEVGLLFIYYTSKDGQIAALVACKMIEGQTLYLYEIQVHPEAQNHQVGSTLIKCFHSLAKKLDDFSLDDGKFDEALRWCCTTEYTALTVFSDNERALQWYKLLGYDYTANSPKDRTTRLRVIKPDYYELEREVN